MVWNPLIYERGGEQDCFFARRFCVECLKGCFRDIKKYEQLCSYFYGAGSGNRTRIASLEGWNSTIELHLQFLLIFYCWEIFCGAGSGNRTRIASLEGWNSTIELHLHVSPDKYRL